MKKKALFNLLFIVTTITIMQSCQLKRIDPTCPSITSIFPNAAGAGDTVIIKGANFLPGLPYLYTVHIGDKAVAVADVRDASTMRFKVPVGLGDGPVSVSVGETVCNNTSPLNFTYLIKVTGIDLLTDIRLNHPAGMVVHGDGSLIVADRGNHAIKRINAGDITEIAGWPGVKGSVDGDNSAARFDNPYDVTVDMAGNIYVADYFNQCIRKISNKTSHPVTTVAGTMNVEGNNNGPALTGGLTNPRAVAINTNNNTLFIVEYTKNRLRRLSNNVLSTTLNVNITPSESSFIGVAYSEKRNPLFPIFVLDRARNKILEVSMDGTNTEIVLEFLPQDIEVDNSGNIIVLDRTYKRIAVVYKDNTILPKYIVTPSMGYTFQDPVGLALDTKNKIIYVSDEAANSIVKVKYQ